MLPTGSEVSHQVYVDTPLTGGSLLAEEWLSGRGSTGKQNVQPQLGCAIFWQGVLVAFSSLDKN